MHINSGNPVSHTPLLAGAERVPELLYSGSQAISAFTANTDDAHLFVQSRTRRINQFFGFDISTGSLDLAAPRQQQFSKHATNFHAFLRAISYAQETSSGGA
jgi:hypothetical protein